MTPEYRVVGGVRCLQEIRGNYLGQAPVMKTSDTAMHFWNGLQLKFPLLFPIAAYVYSIPETSANGERVFSITRYLNDYTKRSTSPFTVEIKTFLRCNYDSLENFLFTYVQNGKYKSKEFLNDLLHDQNKF